MKIVTYKGPGTHYLVLIEEPKMHFIVRKNDKIAMPDKVYDLLFMEEHVGEDKLQLYKPSKGSK